MTSTTSKHQRVMLVTAPVALPPIALFLYSIRHHEPWRDEVQALLLGRDIPLGQLFHAMRLEGTPPLFHLLLKLLCFVLPAPTALPVAAAIGYAVLLAGTLHLLVVLSGRPRVSAAITFALACTNTYFYELGVVSRPYGIGLGLGLAGLAELLVAHKLDRPKRVITGALLCGAAAITSDHAACVAGSVLASFVITEAVRRRSLRPVLPTLASLPFFALTFFLMAPFSERTAEVASARSATLASAYRLAAICVEEGGLAGGWWRVEGSQPPPSWPAFRIFAAALTIIAAVRLYRKRRDRSADLFAFGLFALSWATLLYIFIGWYPGAYRHHLFLWMPAVVIALGWLAEARPSPRAGRPVFVVAALMLSSWFLYQYGLLRDDLLGDVRGDFTQTRAAAAVLPKDAHVVTDHDYAVVGLRLWRDDLTVRSSDSLGRPFTYLVVDRDWHRRVPFQPIVREECRAAPDRTLLALNSSAPGDLARCLTLVQPRRAQLATERFDLFSVDCGCALR